MKHPLTIMIDIFAAAGIIISFAQKTLPVIQWGSAFLGGCWFVYQFYAVLKKKRRGP